jgi:LuxR family maltose regulon positive regulatory protein
LGFAYWISGDLEAAHKAISDAIANMQVLDKITFMISFTSYLADIMIAQGLLNQTMKTYGQLLETAAKRGKPELKETAVLHLGLSELHLEQGDPEAARHHLLIAQELGEQPAFPPWYRHWVLARVRIKESEGDLEGVLKILNGAGNLYYRHPIPDVRPLAALIARTLLAQGRLTEALLWVQEQSLSVDDDLSYQQEFEHITLARILLAQYRTDQANGLIQDTIGLLERLLKAAEEGKRMGSVIEILVLQALAYEAQGKLSPALTSLERALKLAEPEGYVRTFVAEGVPLEALLKNIKTEDPRLKEYVAKLLVAFVEKSYLPPGDQAVIEPLSERELEVLELLADGLTNPEVAARLYLSLNTVKVHTRNIYGKLSVHNRVQAAARAQELGLLSPRSN